jgi:hypothetical protein
MIKTIEIKTEDGPETVTALVNGHFAIHPLRVRRGKDGFGYYTVTHVPTGLAILHTNGILKAKAICNAYEVLPLNWSNSNPYSYQPSVQTLRAIRQRLYADGIAIPDARMIQP